ncbi:MAG: ABC-type transport system, permease component [Chloroflexi bacterium]|nr:ABC-type transport system, permease component [Chloroflexota bacterium]
MAAWTFARLTMREAARSRFLPITLTLALLYIGLIAWGCHLILDHTPSIAAAQASAFGMEIFAFYMVSFVIALLAVFVTGASTHHDGESGLLQAMLARPVRRFDVLFGRWLGASLLVAFYVILLTGGLVLAVGLSVGYYPSRPVEAAALLLLQGLAILSLRLLFGTFLGNMASGILPLMLYGLAWMGGLVETVGQALSVQAMVTAGIVTSLLIPTDELWRGVAYFLAPETASALLTQALGRGNPFISLTPIAAPMVAWSCFYVVATFLVAAWSFARRDV